jgi:hypothetical protein
MKDVRETIFFIGIIIFTGRTGTKQALLPEKQGETS